MTIVGVRGADKSLHALHIPTSPLSSPYFHTLIVASTLSTLTNMMISQMK